MQTKWANADTEDERVRIWQESLNNPGSLAAFAELIVRECISVLNEAADDIDNGNIFNDQELLNKFEERWSAGLYYSVDKIKEHFGVEE